MLRIIDLSHTEAKKQLLKGESYFNSDLPKYISFEPILNKVDKCLSGGVFNPFKSKDPADIPGVNYSFLSNKDGRFAWRPYELMHPAIYVSLVNTICDEKNWKKLRKRFAEFSGGVVECTSIPVISETDDTNKAIQIHNWWQKVEQKSLVYSLEFTHLLHTDVTDCYGSLYTHSIAWAVEGLSAAKSQRNDKSTLGNKIDSHVRAGRFGQSNGISQGSVLMDFIAELVLGFIDLQINEVIDNSLDVRILRYRDDYRIFANSDSDAEKVLQIVSDELRSVGMKLGVAKTSICQNIVEGSIKSDKLAGIDLQDLGISNAKTLQKQLLRLHTFGRRFPNSGALRRLICEFHENLYSLDSDVEDLEVQVAIATDIAYESPSTFPAIAGILSHLISIAKKDKQVVLWNKVCQKMKQVPYSGFTEVWLQRIARPELMQLGFISKEPLCQIVDGVDSQLWNSEWISGDKLKNCLKSKNLIVKDAKDSPSIIQIDEVQIFKKNSLNY